MKQHTKELPMVSRSGSRRFRPALLAVATTLAAGVVSFAGAPSAFAAAATVGNGITTTDLSAAGMSPITLANTLVGAGVTVSNVAYSGAAAQAGLLHVVDPAVVSFNDGIILSSGNIADVVGPNKSDGITGDMLGPSDPDLDALIKNTQTVNPVTFDAVVLEFDFVPTASPVYFTYTFGSDEYLEWVNLFNDVFAFYVNGTNCATVPGGEPVSIDTINSTVNPQLFRDNSFSSPPANPINIESDGLSVELICSAPVNVGQINHMKLALADTSDQILDSVVMIKAHTLSTTKPESCNDGVDNDDDQLVDMDDDSCSSTTTPPPAGSGGIGSGSSGPPFTGNEGSPILLDAAALGWAAPGEAISASWTVTGINGTPGTCDVTPAGRLALNPDGSFPVVSAVCPNEGEYVARVDAWDGEGKSAYDSDVDFFVHNAPPAVFIDTPASAGSSELGTPLALSVTVLDPGPADVVTCTVDWGDGTVEALAWDGATCAGTHTYGSTGTYIVSLTATDDAGDSSASAVVVSVVPATPPPNTPPSADAGGPYSGVEGTPVTLNGTATDADGDPLTTQWEVVLSPGAAPGTACVLDDPASLTTTVTCNDDAAFFATLTADDGAATASSTTTGTVANDVPTVAVVSPAGGTTLNTGKLLGVTATVSDPGTNDTLTCSIAWGDGATTPGTVSAGQCTGSHVYTTGGPKFVTVSVADDDGAAATATVLVQVTAVPAPTITSLKPTSGKVGTKVTIAGANFTGATTVRFNGTPATFTVVSGTKLTAVVPAGATTGPVSVTTPGGTAASATAFTVIVPAPTISGFTPASGPVGATVTITGTAFTGATAVRFNGIAATFTVVSPTTITAVVPAGASTGRIKVTTAGGTATSKKNFVVV